MNVVERCTMEFKNQFPTVQSSIHMEKNGLSQRSSPRMESNVDPNDDDEFDNLIPTLERKTNWDGRVLINYGGFWYLERFFRPLIASKKYFRAKDTDIIITSMLKSGTTWLKALVFAIVNRNSNPIIHQSPLLTSNPHVLIPTLEIEVYWKDDNPDLQHIPEPRLFSTHRSFDHLPDSVFDCGCKLVYICRNPLDQFISFRHFTLENNFGRGAKPLSVEEAFQDFCNGIHPCGPIFDHILGYWNAHTKNPEKVLFLRYEDLKEDIELYVKKIAGFIGVPFSLEEEKNGIVQEIAKLCSFDHLKDLEINKTEDNNNEANNGLKYSSFFRKGVVGDWRNHLSPEMAERLIKVMEKKFEGSGLVLRTI